MKPVVLASSSPRRRALLESTGLIFTIDAAESQEDVQRNLKPADLVMAISLEKARAAGPRHPGSIIIAADTLGVLDGKLLVKPGNSKEAIDMLHTMSGRRHTVLTGFTILDSGTGRVVSKVVESRVHFKKLTDKETPEITASVVEFILEGAHLNKRLNKSKVEGKTIYRH